VTGTGHLSGPEHYRKGEQLLADAERIIGSMGPAAALEAAPFAAVTVQIARAHFAAASAAATVDAGYKTMLPEDQDRWGPVV